MFFLFVSLGIFLLVNLFRVVLPFVVLNRLTNRHINFREIHKAEDFGLESRHFFVRTDDGLNISVYEVSIENPVAVILCLAGMNYPSATAYLGHARHFREMGFATFFFDLRAHGESDGDMICMGYREHLDTKAVVNYIKSDKNYSDVPLVAMGLSLGASTAIISAGEMPEIDGIISLSAFSSWEDIFCDKMNAYSPEFFAKLEKPLAAWSAKVKYKVDTRRWSPVNAIGKLGARPALLMHSTEDKEVPFENFKRLMERAPAHVETFIRKGDCHSVIQGKFTSPEMDEDYFAVLTQFLRKNYIRN